MYTRSQRAAHRRSTQAYLCRKGLLRDTAAINSPRSCSREVKIRVTFFLQSILGEPYPKKGERRALLGDLVPNNPGRSVGVSISGSFGASHVETSSVRAESHQWDDLEEVGICFQHTPQAELILGNWTLQCGPSLPNLASPWPPLAACASVAMAAWVPFNVSG